MMYDRFAYKRVSDPPVGVAENGKKLFRTATGSRRWARVTPPTEAEKAQGKAALLPYPSDAWCPCCRTTYGVDIYQYESIEAHGVCGQCWLLAEGIVGATECQRLPTVEEALLVPPHDLRPDEVAVIRQALVELRAKGG